MSPQIQILKLKEYILGELSEQSKTFLLNLCAKDINALDKLISKLQKNSIYIKAKDLELIIKALSMQNHLSANILPTINYHLQDKNPSGLANTLTALATKLEHDLTTVDTLQAILTIMNNLQIFSLPSPQEKFIRSILILMLNFHTKQHKNNHNNYQDSAKWLKSLLAISAKSDLTCLIDYLALRLNIAQISLHGNKNNLELTELFFTLEETTNRFDYETCNVQNTELIKKLNACIVINIICKINPLAFVDIVASQVEDKKTNFAELTNGYFSTQSQLLDFLQSNNYQPYLTDYDKKLQPTFTNDLDTTETKQKIKKNSAASKMLYSLNLQAFLMCFTNLLHEEFTHKFNDHTQEVQVLKKFILNCNHYSENMQDNEYQNFLAKQIIEPRLVEVFIKNIFPTIHNKLKETNKNSKSLNYLANKLTTLGCAPRAISFAKLGMFVPIINKKKLNQDYINIAALKDFMHNLNKDKKTAVIKELFISLLVRYRANPYKIENQPQPKNLSQQYVNTYLPIKHFNCRILSKLALKGKFRANSKRRTGVYTSTNKESRLDSLKKVTPKVELRKKSAKNNNFSNINYQLTFFSKKDINHNHPLDIYPNP